MYNDELMLYLKKKKRYEIEWLNVYDDFFYYYYFIPYMHLYLTFATLVPGIRPDQSKSILINNK
jgi:hypothetical protein